MPFCSYAEYILEIHHDRHEIKVDETRRIFFNRFVFQVALFYKLHNFHPELALFLQTWLPSVFSCCSMNLKDYDGCLSKHFKFQAYLQTVAF